MFYRRLTSLVVHKVVLTLFTLHYSPINSFPKNDNHNSWPFSMANCYLHRFNNLWVITIIVTWQIGITWHSSSIIDGKRKRSQIMFGWPKNVLRLVNSLGFRLLSPSPWSHTPDRSAFKNWRPSQGKPQVFPKTKRVKWELNLFHKKDKNR